MPKDYAIVALDINTDDSNFLNYNSKTAKEKIDFLAQRIEKVCQTLASSEPDSNWIISWREYGVTDPNSRYISNDDKKYLKDVMCKLSAKHPQLTIISGTAETKKHFAKDDAANEIKKVEGFYTQAIIDEVTEGATHFAEVEKAVKHKHPHGIDVARNTAYIFSNGACVGRHDKHMPFIELTAEKKWYSAGNSTKRNNHLADAIYQPADKKDKSAIFTIGKDEDALSLGIEICREHCIGTLLSEVKDKGVIPSLQLIISEGMSPEIDKITSEYVILLDDTIKPQLLVTKNVDTSKLDKLPIRLYQENILKQEPLLGPLKPSCITNEIAILYEFDIIEHYISSSGMSSAQSRLVALEQLKLLYVYELSRGKSLENFKDDNIQNYNTITLNSIKHPDANITKMTQKLDDMLDQISQIKVNLAPSKDVDVLNKPLNIPVVSKVMTSINKAKNATKNAIKNSIYDSSAATTFKAKRTNPKTSTSSTSSSKHYHPAKHCRII